jgi:hypothetical protein
MGKTPSAAIPTPEQLNAGAFMDLILDGMELVAFLGNFVYIVSRFQLTLVETLGLSGALKRRFRIDT